PQRSPHLSGVDPRLPPGPLGHPFCVGALLPGPAASCSVWTAERSFNADHSSYWQARVEAGFFDRITTLALILGPDGSPVGWGGHHRRRFAGRRVLYLDSTGVLPAHRRFGLSTALMMHFLSREVFPRPLLPTHLLMCTRHPGVYNGWRQGFGPGRVFPHPSRPTPASIRRIAG